MRRTVIAAGIGVLLLAAGAGWWYGATAVRAPATSAADQAALLATGERTYANNCVECHGPAGGGQPDWRQRKANGRMPAPPLNGTGHTWHHPDPHLYAVVSKGVAALAPEGYQSDMKGFGDKLSERETRAVIAYVKQWWAAEIRARQKDITERATSSR
ncbi:c-type cytochrome [Ferruginivarius sediminum]|uniref:Cytochrome c n=1 Tax=Ferruginivarius sediminum TaxID=2661937 RepID=A0A369T9P2_9PROT|nr:cytochrome c [Ferruginivarius sediminum]RDD62051.1 cytochrome c [Ferruginivarius sediminum]